MVAANLSADSAQIGWFGLMVGGHPALSLHSANEPGELYRNDYVMMTAP